MAKRDESGNDSKGAWSYPIPDGLWSAMSLISLILAVSSLLTLTLPFGRMSTPLLSSVAFSLAIACVIKRGHPTNIVAIVLSVASFVILFATAESILRSLRH